MKSLLHEFLPKIKFCLIKVEAQILESKLVIFTFLGEISVTSDMEMTPPLWLKVKKN